MLIHTYKEKRVVPERLRIVQFLRVLNRVCVCLYVRTGKNLGVCVVGRGVERGEGCMMHSVCNMSDASGGGVIGKVQMSLPAVQYTIHSRRGIQRMHTSSPLSHLLHTLQDVGH